MQLDIIKFGGSVISQKSSKDKFEKEIVERIGREFYPFHKKSIFVHGTGFVGKPPAIKYGYYKEGRSLKKDFLQMLKIKEDLRLLNHKFVDTMLSLSIPVLPFSISSFFTETMDRLKGNATTYLKKTIDLGYVPVFYGDLMPCSDGSFRVFSSDIIIKILSHAFNPENVLFLSNVKGVCQNIEDTSSVLEDKNIIKTLNYKTARLVAGSSSDEKDVSGGMTEKISCALEIASQCKRCFIGCGFTPELVSDFFSGKQIEGTEVKAEP
ncbi:MAG: hypothetical protein KAJ62_12795 [Desulfobacteraceae bacterium]|nr:hypothetical protein [Desulfobacteraceae bacterium]